MNDKLQCTARTAAGERCRKAALPGVRVCATHAGADVGRRSSLTPEVQRRILQVLQAGGYVETAVAAAGVSMRSYTRWMGRGREDAADYAPEYEQFRQLVHQARAESEARNVALIAQAAATNWNAAAWLLERQYPERWARPSQREKSEESAGTTSAGPTDPFAEVDELAQRRRP